MNTFNKKLVFKIIVFLMLFFSRTENSHAACYWQGWLWVCDAYTQILGQVSMAQDVIDEDLPVRAEHNAACAADPVYLHSGQFYYQCNDLSVPGRQIDVDIGHTYFSGMSFNGQFGYGWMLNYYQRLHVLRGGHVVIVSGDGRKTKYTFNGTAYIPPAGRFESLVKNPDNTFTLTAAHGEKEIFDAQGRLTAIQDRNGNALTLSYSAQKQPVYGRSEFGQNPSSEILLGNDYQLTQITDTNGRAINFSYSSDGRLSTITDNVPGGGTRVVTFAYDANTRDLLSVTKTATTQFPSGITKSFEYVDHNVKKVRDPKLQYFVENFYDTAGRVYQQNLGGSNFLFDYSVPNQVTETDRKGYATQYVFNAAGNVTTKTEFTKPADGIRDGAEPASYVTTYSYNSDSLQTSVTYPRGNGVVNQYDTTMTGGTQDGRAKGNLLKTIRVPDMSVVTNPVTYTPQTSDIATAFTYETLFNQIDSITDPKGNVTSFTYDHELPTNDPKYALKGNVVLIEQPAITTGPYQGTPTTEFAYNTAGQVTEVKDPNNNLTQYAYYPATGYLQSVRQDPNGINALTQMTYDNFGNVDVVTDANNHTTDYDYDALGWLNQVTDSLGYLTKNTFDANGNIVKVEKQASDPVGTWQTTEFTYDILNKLKTVKDPLLRITTNNYDNNENLSSVVDANNKTTSYVYDERDKLFSVTDANVPAGVTKYDYDLNGNLAKITDANLNPTTYTYDLFDRTTATTFADLSAETLEYDKNSNLTKHTRPNAKVIDYTYDVLNRLTGKTYPQNASLNTTFSYDLGGRVRDADNTAASIDHTYDALNRVASETQTLNTVPYALGYQYDLAGNRTKLTYPSGKVVDYVYDANNRLDVIKRNGVNFADYDYDPLNRRISRSLITSHLPLTTYTYDIANQLSSITNKLVDNTPVSVYAYPTYDLAGNRTRMDRTFQSNPVETTNYGYNNIYELTSVTGAQTHSFDYDAVANREVADSVSYITNNLNQYTNVGGVAKTYELNGNLTFDGTNTYSYDEENRLSFATTPSSTSTYQYDALGRRVAKTVNGVTTYFVHDGDDIIQDRNAAGNVTAEYIHGSNVDEVLTMEQGGNTYYYHQDGLGSVSEITNASGAVVENYIYDVYGQPSVVNSAIGNRYRFTGREFEEESGLYHYRARAYSPAIGRFLQRDPIGYLDHMNLHAYTGNNPIKFIDPYGLYSTEEFLQDASNFSAGLGDSLSFGITKTIRQSMGSDFVVQHDSGLYTAGVFSSFGFGAGRLAYAGTAKVASVAYGLTPTVANAEKAVQFRNQLKIIFSANPYRTRGIYSFEQMLSKYGDALGVIRATGRTNPFVNLLGLDAFFGGLRNMNECK